jgi:hypothetical protein
VNVQDLGSIGELIAALATIATLAYLAMQIRQNTVSVRATTFRSYVESAINWMGSIYKDPELCDLWNRGREDLSSLDKAEQARFSLATLAFFRVFENAHYQVQQGLVQDLEWEGIRESFLLLIDCPGVRVWWNENQSRYNSPFRAFVDAELRERAA